MTITRKTGKTLIIEGNKVNEYIPYVGPHETLLNDL